MIKYEKYSVAMGKIYPISNSTWNLNAKILKLIGFETHTRWTPDEYVVYVR